MRPGVAAEAGGSQGCPACRGVCFYCSTLARPLRPRSPCDTAPLPSLSLPQAIEKWGTWGQVAPGVRNGQSEIKLSKLEFSRPAAIAEQFEADEGFTGLVQVR